MKLVEKWWKAWTVWVAAAGVALPEILQLIAENTALIPFLPPEWQGLIRLAALVLVLIFATYQAVEHVGTILGLEGAAMSLPPMSSALADELNELIPELYWAELMFAEYRMLYGKDEERIGFLNAVAPRFFGVSERLMWAQILLQLTKLTAKKKALGHDNLTIQRLPDLVYPSIRWPVANAAQVAIDAAKFADDPCNKLYAHLDLTTSLTAVVPFDLGSRQQVREALEALWSAINAVSTRCGDGVEHMANFDHGDGSAEDLIEVLRLGMTAMESRRQNLSEPRWSPGA